MVFHSFTFLLLFLPCVVILNWVLRTRNNVTARTWVLLLASLVFYVAAGLRALPLLVGSLLVNWFVAHRIHQAVPGSGQRRGWLTAGVAVNVALLAVIKYSHFLADNIGSVTGWHVAVPAFVLPLGISFFTIQQTMYLVDCFEELTPPAPLLQHALFILFFPYVAAGPIARAGKVLPQLQTPGPPDEPGLATGFVIFIIGLCKKVVLADTFARFADAGFSAASPLGFTESWITAASYTFQLYFDFSGYSDMALGIGLMLDVKLPENFNSPLKATSVVDFWRRWHITLSGFITTYLYTPLVRRMQPLTFRKAMLVTLGVMAIAGIWHGAAWTFLLFGVLHGSGLVVNHVWRKMKFKLPVPIAWLLTFIFLMVSFEIFRAHDWSQAHDVLSGMLGAHGMRDLGNFAGISRADRVWCYLVMLCGAGIALLARNSNELARSFRPSWRWSLVCSACVLLCLLFLNSSKVTGFIYRDF
jgi:D-alanyl-lipoteichoic acid acyltransferase DltB (MBOAT superfamily)